MYSAASHAGVYPRGRGNRTAGKSNSICVNISTSTSWRSVPVISIRGEQATSMSLVEGVEQLETFFGQYFPQLAVAALTPPLIFVFMAAFDVQTAYVFLAFALFTLILPLLTTGWTGESSLQRRKAYSALGAEFLDAVQGLATSKPSARVAPTARCWPSARVICIAVRWGCWRPTSPPA